MPTGGRPNDQRRHRPQELISREILTHRTFKGNLMLLKHRPLNAAALAACIVALSMTGCATTVGQAPGAMEVRQGVIEQIMPTELQSTEHTGLGAVVGGVTGLGLGSLIGRGTGRDVAMLLGAVGGGLIGNNTQAAANDGPLPGQEVIVRTRSGVLVSVTQPINPELHEGQRVYLEGSGQIARVIPQY
jgi:outer membrane lipoprotein SlyB